MADLITAEKEHPTLTGIAACEALSAVFNAEEGSREYPEAKYGHVWSTKQLQEDFDVLGFAAPCVVVIRKSDGKKGTLFFHHAPRYYWGFEVHTD